MNANTKLAAAVAAVLASATSMAGQPTPASAAAPAVGLYVAGSSAAKNAILGALETTICAGSYSLFSSTGDTNFFAVSCTPSSSTGLPSANGTNIFTIWYRDEGGSVTGALPLVSGSQINQLSLAGASGSAGSYTVSVPGSSASNGIDDSFASGVFKAPVQFGITDVEPARLTGNNYPSAYKTSVYGKATATQLGNLSATPLFDQVFGVFVNTTPSGFTTAEKAGQGTATASLSLSQQTIANILNGTISNWNDTPNFADTTGGTVTGSTSVPIIIVNREQGSGSRTSTDIFFQTDECNGGQTPILETTGGTADYFSTGNVLAAANTVPGSITYASIDNAGSSSFPNLTLVAVNGVQPSNFNAAQGAYGEWFEATGVTGSNFSGLTEDQQDLITDLISAFQTEATGPVAADILADPNFNTPAYPITSTSFASGGHTIYVNPFTRNGASCNVPAVDL